MIVAETKTAESKIESGQRRDEERLAERRRVRQRRVSRAERRWWRRRAINLFLAWHIFALFIWLTPNQSAIVQACVGLVRPYLTATALGQSWSMFSPDPDRMDVYLTAQITYADGEKQNWEFPRMVHMGYVRRYEEERWRKMTENVTHGGNHVLWPAMARYAARVNNRDAQNPPVSVEMFQHMRMIPPPGQPIPPYAVTPLLAAPGHPFVLTIQPGDLR